MLTDNLEVVQEGNIHEHIQENIFDGTLFHETNFHFNSINELKREISSDGSQVEIFFKKIIKIFNTKNNSKIRKGHINNYDRKKNPPLDENVLSFLIELEYFLEIKFLEIYPDFVNFNVIEIIENFKIENMNKGYLLLFELIKDIRKTYDKSKKDTLLEEKKVTLKENEEKEKADIKSIYDKIKNINLNDFKKILQHYIKLTKGIVGIKDLVNTSAYTLFPINSISLDNEIKIFNAKCKEDIIKFKKGEIVQLPDYILFRLSELLSKQHYDENGKLDNLLK